MGRIRKEINFMTCFNLSQTPMISASTSSEGPPPAPPPPHHPLIGPPSVTMTQLPMPLPLPLPLYPHHQLAPPPHPYHALHHHHTAAAAAVAMMAFEHQHGRHHMAHHLSTVPPPGRSPSPPRFLRPPPPPSRPLLPYNGVRSPEGAETRVEEGADSRQDDGPGAVNLVHKRPEQCDDPTASKRSRMVNGGLGGRPLGPSDPIGGFVSHGGLYASGPPYYSSTSTLLGHSPPSTTCSTYKHPLLGPHPLVTPRPHHPEQSTAASSMVAPTFTSPAITVGPITTPSFSYDPFFAAGAQSSVKPGQSVLRRPSATRPQQPTTAFKVPSGKEGSLKHRLLLTRTSESYGNEPPSPTSGGKRRKGKEPASPAEAPRISPTPSPPVASKSPLEECFSKGSLIRLQGGKVVKVEELKTEDFVKSAEGSEEIRLDPSTVVGLEARPDAGTARLTLAYGSERQRSQVELESTLEQPFFVVGRGWASVCPEKSLQRFGLSCLRLRVGHVCISLTERISSKEKDEKTKASEVKSSDDTCNENKPSHSSSGTSNESSGSKKSEETFISSESNVRVSGDVNSVSGNHSSSMQHHSLSPSSRRRRWSAPGPLSTDDEEETKVPAMIQPNRTSIEVAHSTVES